MGMDAHVLEVQVDREKHQIMKIEGSKASLSEFGTIEYGTVPRSCLQTVPKIESPPPLRDDIVYSATAVIFDNGPVVLRFSINKGTVISQ